MEKISRQRFIQIAVAVIVVCAVIFLLRNGGGNNTEKLLLGDWYERNSSRVFVSLYDNGSCKVAGDYGLGKVVDRE